MEEKPSRAAKSLTRSVPVEHVFASPPPGTRQVPVSDILGEEREALLIHNGDAYRLRITANNKLILTK